MEPYLTHVPFSYLALRQGEFDLAHAMNAPDALAAITWARHTSSPVIVSHMGIPDRPGLTEHRRTLDVWRRAAAGADALVVLSQHAAAAAQRWLGVQARVIPPGVDLSAFRPGPARAEHPVIICSAQPEVPRKHVGLLLQAFGLVRREIPQARLVLSRPRDAQAARAAGIDLLAPGVEWADLDDRATLAQAYARAWVCALPSENEGFGLVLAEALACGTPVVGFDHGAIPEVLGEEDVGRLFTRLEPAALAGALLETIELSRDPATASRCRTRAEEFSTERCAEAYLELYRELV
jgi:glycosyltransferase involved in cell wall biosynthesis